MNEQTDLQLLRTYVEHRSEPAFAELVQRHVDFVYSAALRMVCDSHLAQDVTQGVFVALANNATHLTDRPVLSGWLHRTAQNIAAQTVRTDVRRRVREQEAAAMNELLTAESNAVWEEIAPHLDTALGELGESDRDAVLLRYFEHKSAHEMAQILGTTDDTAQKRVSRAVERLRESFAKRGITAGASGLIVVISANAVQAAPVGLAISISAAALTATAISAATIATQTTMSWINLKSVITIAAAAIVAGTGTHIVQQRETNRLRNENQNLVAQQKQLTTERDKALLATGASNDEMDRLRKDQNELLRLRGEVGLLRKQSNELDRLKDENRGLKSSIAEMAKASQPKAADPDSDPFRQGAIAKMNDAKQLVMALMMYAADNQNQLPMELNQSSNYLGTANSILTSTNQFELIVQGSLINIINPSEILAVREKEAWFANGKWFKTYGFADGHSEVHTESDSNFDAWEKQRLMIQPGH